MPSSLGHLKTFSERPHMSTEQRKGAGRACSGAGCECVEHCASAKARSNACFNHKCLRVPALGHKYNQSSEESGFFIRPGHSGFPDSGSYPLLGHAADRSDYAVVSTVIPEDFNTIVTGLLQQR